MTRLLSTILLTTMLTSTSFGQTDNTEITNTFESYFEMLEQKNNEKALDYIYPKLFDSFPKDKMLQAMNKAKADTTTIVGVYDASVINISETLLIDEIKYALIKYSFKMTMTISAIENGSGAAKEEEEEEDDPIDFTYEILIEKYGEKNVQYDRENRKFDVDVTNEMYAIKSPVYHEWKFLEKKSNMKPLLEKLIPKSVLKKL